MSKLAGSEWLVMTLVKPAALEDRAGTLHALGFEPAFFDYATCRTYPSRRADGQPSNEHVLDGLPDEAVAVRADCGRVIAPRASLMAGYVRDGWFYTREAAWRAAREWGRAA